MGPLTTIPSHQIICEDYEEKESAVYFFSAAIFANLTFVPSKIFFAS